MSGDIIMLNHPIFSKKIFINFNKDILKPKPTPQTDEKSLTKNYRIPPRKFILKSRGDRFGNPGSTNPEDPSVSNEYVYKSSRKDKIQVHDYIKTEPNLDEHDPQPIQRELKRYRTLILSIKKPERPGLSSLQSIPQKPLDLRQSDILSPRSYIRPDKYRSSPKGSLSSENVLGFFSPKNNKTPLYP
jgi:hypothetical protein